jgi:hypothetical protein
MFWIVIAIIAAVIACILIYAAIRSDTFRVLAQTDRFIQRRHRSAP